MQLGPNSHFLRLRNIYFPSRFNSRWVFVRLTISTFLIQNVFVAALSELIVYPHYPQVRACACICCITSISVCTRARSFVGWELLRGLPWRVAETPSARKFFSCLYFCPAVAVTLTGPSHRWSRCSVMHPSLFYLFSTCRPSCENTLAKA